MWQKHDQFQLWPMSYDWGPEQKAQSFYWHSSTSSHVPKPDFCNTCEIPARNIKQVEEAEVPIC